MLIATIRKAHGEVVFCMGNVYKALCICYKMAVLRVVPRLLKCYFLLQ